jgi:hypothetical protein
MADLIDHAIHRERGAAHGTVTKAYLLTDIEVAAAVVTDRAVEL